MLVSAFKVFSRGKCAKYKIQDLYFEHFPRACQQSRAICITCTMKVYCLDILLAKLLVSASWFPLLFCMET